MKAKKKGIRKPQTGRKIALVFSILLLLILLAIYFNAAIQRWLLNLDTDDDGLTDVIEREIYRTNPLNSDTDGDGISDEWEVLDRNIFWEFQLDPLNPDIDGDGMLDGDEFNDACRSFYNSNDMNAICLDLDKDGLDDAWEFEEFGCMSAEYEGYIVRPTGLISDPQTHLALKDELGNDIYAQKAIPYATNPPSYNDESFQNMASNRRHWVGFANDPDRACLFEEQSADLYPNVNSGNDYDFYGCETTSDPNILLCPVPARIEFTGTDDIDSDGCNHLCEHLKHTEPLEGLERNFVFYTNDNSTNRVNPAKLDSDGDGLTDYDERNYILTDYQNPDTDGDGINDGTEMLRGTNPISLD